MKSQRFQVRKNHDSKSPWLVEDVLADPAEDVVIYHFPAKKKVEAFKVMMVIEHCNCPRK